ncbi:MAG TPA: hypothetical protein VHA52_13595 [Candidatus Babeliaceae bacterium]|nr:hypothetical protein [Candidatus Babeliaceae bacterium]
MAQRRQARYYINVRHPVPINHYFNANVYLMSKIIKTATICIVLGYAGIKLIELLIDLAYTYFNK